MLRTALTALLLAGVLAAAAGAEPRPLFPGVTYDRQVQFSRYGPVVMHVLTAPKPAGAYALEPVLSNGAVVARERLTAIQRRAAGGARVAGVNGDYFAADGRPDGIFMENRVVHRPPLRTRSSLGIDAQGNLVVDRVQMLASYTGTGPRRPLNGLNSPPGRNAITLFTPAWGPTTPPAADTVSIALSDFEPTTANTELTGRVIERAQGGGRRIPSGGAMLVARGAAAERLAAEAPMDATVSVRLVLHPDWGHVVDAIGGGPALVRNGRPIFRAQEAFPAVRLVARQARTAIGQRANGQLVFIAVDGDQPGYSAGMSNFELAQALVRLGAVTGYALGGGAATTMAADGRLLNRPAVRGGEQPIADALLLLYRPARR